MIKINQSVYQEDVDKNFIMQSVKRVAIRCEEEIRMLFLFSHLNRKYKKDGKEEEVSYGASN